MPHPLSIGTSKTFPPPAREKKRKPFSILEWLLIPVFLVVILLAFIFRRMQLPPGA